MKDTNKFTNLLKKMLAKKGFYIVLLACIISVCVAIPIKNMIMANLAAKKVMDDQAWQKTVGQDPMKDALAAVPAANMNVSKTPAPKSTTPTERPAQPKTQNTTPTKLSYPVEGSILKDYAMDTLAFSETYNDWRTHPGIDIAADLGAQVKAAADGTVSEVYTDDSMGVTVAITHPGNLKTVYSNLQSEGFIKKGTDVKRGTIIGGIGSSAVSESAQPSHLHFEVLKDNSPVNPRDYIQ